MTSRFRTPVFLLALVAGLIAFAVQSGELGCADTQHRLQSAHAFWTSEPAVFPSEYPDFGARGRNGKLQSWYGIGQSLLLLPTDIVGTYIERLPIFARYAGTDPTVKNILVSFTTNIFLTVATALVCFRLLGLFGFTVRQSVAGALSLLVLTTHLHYTQNLMENNYICLLTLTGFCYQFEWLKTGSRRALLIGSAAFGLNLLTRLTTGLDLLAGALFLPLVLLFEGTRGTEFWARVRACVAIALPVYCFFGLLDRLYQFYRFGSFTNTYVSVVAKETLARNPDWPRNYPFEVPFHVGFWGAIGTPEKSIFLFDPMLILMILLVMVAWKRFSAPAKAYIVSAFAMLLAYICFYARYTVWSGDSAWGDRYVSTAAELCTLLAVPLLLRHRGEVSKLVWRVGLAIIAVSLAVQLASVAFWLSLELYQIEIFGYPTWVVPLRFKNIAAFALGKVSEWGLTTNALSEDPWDYQHITCWNFLPFVLQRVGVAPAWVVNLAFGVWAAGLAGLAWALLRLRKALAMLG